MTKNIFSQKSVFASLVFYQEKKTFFHRQADLPTLTVVEYQMSKGRHFGRFHS